jgi:hypothetical protein
MTHGPHGSQHSFVDQIDDQKMGYLNLLRAVSRVNPLMHCFGHTDEGHGVTWKPKGGVKDPLSATQLEIEQIKEYPYADEWPIKPGTKLSWSMQPL